MRNKRPKTRYKSNSSLAVAWAVGTLSPNAEHFEANSMEATHDKIFSWGPHFCIAEKRDGLILFTEKTRSNSTAKHKSLVACALNRSCCKQPIHVSSLDGGEGPREWVSNKLEMASSMYRRATKARSLKSYHTMQSVHLLNGAVNLCKQFALPLPTPAALPPGYLDFLVVEAFKAKCEGEDFPKLHSCYTTTPTAVAA
jgi:hypothetical protein